jgi:hypothetical protein
MAHSQHKLSRRALLAGACALPLARHCEARSDAAIQCGLSTVPAAGWVDLRSPSARCAGHDGKARDGKWREALARFREADLALEALVHCRNQRVYDRALAGIPPPSPACCARRRPISPVHCHRISGARSSWSMDG